MHRRYRDVSARPKNRALTEKRLIDAVGSIIRTRGYKALGVNAIAREADVNKKLIYRYFGTVDELIETYILENDYWMILSRERGDLMESAPAPEEIKEAIISILEGQFDYFLNHQPMQSIILWGITEHVDILNSMGNIREIFGDVIFKKTDDFFNDTRVSLRAISAILVSGIYYMVLHTVKNEGRICGIDISSPEGRKEIVEAIRQIVEWSFDQARPGTNK